MYLRRNETDEVVRSGSREGIVQEGANLPVAEERLVKKVVEKVVMRIICGEILIGDQWSVR